MLMCAAFPRNSSPQKPWAYPAGPHLGVVAPVPWPRGPAAVAAPASFLKDVRALLTGLAGHDEVDAPFTGLGDKTQALALGASIPASRHQGYQEVRVGFYLFFLWKKWFLVFFMAVPAL